MAKLVLVPTPIADDIPLCIVAHEQLQQAFANDDIIVVEEHKVGRRRWLSYGLPREAIDKFVLYNEHNAQNISSELCEEIKKGRNVYLMSDCGLPAFCDPGRRLVDLCHDSNITVTATPFANSISLAIALSGFNHTRFMFEGFIPIKEPQRSQTLKKALIAEYVSVIMDTPYRMHKLLELLQELAPGQEIFLAMDLNKPTENLLRGTVAKVMQQLPETKAEFILLIKGQK